MHLNILICAFAILTLSLSFWNRLFLSWNWTWPQMKFRGFSLKSEQNGKWCRSWWDCLLWDTSSGSTLYRYQFRPARLKWLRGENRLSIRETIRAWKYLPDFSLEAIILITKTYLYNFDPLKPHFYIVKLGFTGVYIIFLLQNIHYGYSLELPQQGGSNKYPKSMFWAEIWKISGFLYENFQFFMVKFFNIFE